jgi:hypothetical protein
MLTQIPSLDGYEIAVASPDAFAGATLDARGDVDGANVAYTLFQVNGEVLVRIFGVCTVDLAGAATLEIGVAGNTAKLIAQTTATGIDANDIWNDATPTAVGMDTLAAVTGPYLIVNGADIIETTASANITSGQIYYICLWKAITPGSNVIALPIQEGADIRGY